MHLSLLVSFFGLKPATVEAIKDVGMSSLKLINDIVLFPRTIPFTPSLGDDSATLKSKVFLLGHTKYLPIFVWVKLVTI
nr:hypothetical protein [Escherichia coli]